MIQPLDYSTTAQATAFLDEETCILLIKCIEVHKENTEVLTLLQLKELMELCVNNSLNKAQNKVNTDHFKSKVNKYVKNII